MHNFKFDFLRDFRGNYIVVQVPPALPLVNHQVALIEQNRLEGIMPLTLKEINGQKQLYYQVNSFLSWESSLERGTLTISEALEILDKIVAVLLQSHNYLLFAPSFLLDPAYIYVQGTAVLLLYLPVKMAGDLEHNFRELLGKIERSFADFPQNLKEYSQAKAFNLAGLQKEIRASLLGAEGQIVGAEKVVPCFSLKREDLGIVAPEKSSFFATFLKKINLPPQVIVLFGLSQIIIILGLMGFGPWLALRENRGATYLGLFFSIVLLDLVVLRFLTKKAGGSKLWP